MSLTAGTRLGAYEIIEPLGAGGMGVVYRARDTKLQRDAALKILPESVANDPDRLMRFEREAQTLAALNHPNIAGIYGLEESSGVRALAMELIVGDDLSNRIAGGAMAVEDVVPIGRQIAEALEAAHEAGIVHRDLKPANIKIRPDGTVKVLDFGLAKVLDTASGPQDFGTSGRRHAAAAEAATVTSPALTTMGLVLGTAAYMSPEQAKGKPVDRRADIWAFGVVLYEMLTGRQLFQAETISEVIAAVLRADIDLSLLPAGTPRAIRRLIARCLDRDPKTRLQHIGEARIVLTSGAAGDDETAAAAVPIIGPPSRTSWWIAAVASVVAIGAVAQLARGRADAPASPALVRLTMNVPDGAIGANARPLTISPDGRRIAFVGIKDGVSRLFVRALDDPMPKALDGTEGAGMPFFDPTGEWLAFFVDDKLKKVGTGGSGLGVIATGLSSPKGGTWGTDGTIYFAPGTVTGISAVPSAGGTVREVTTLDAEAGEISHRWPQILADEDTLLFTEWVGPGYDERSVVAQSLRTGVRRNLVSGGDTGRYADGFLVYGRRGALFAVPWRPGGADGPTGAPAELAQVARGPEGHSYEVSDNGTLVYLKGDPAEDQQQVVWVNRDGTSQALDLPARDYEVVALSPDGLKAVVQLNDGRETLWILDVARGSLAPFRTPEGSSQSPVWTPDGKYLIYRGTRAGTRNMYRKRADGVGDEERLTTADGVAETPQAVSPDGRWLVFTRLGGPGGGDILALDLTAPAGTAPRPIVATPEFDGSSRISPDGRWIVYASNGTTGSNIYVQAFPDAGPVYPVSTDGGAEPLWSRDGREIFYVPPSRDGLMVAKVTPGPVFSVSQPRMLFTGHYKSSVHSSTGYDVAADGRFLRIRESVVERALTGIEITLNWPAGLSATGAGR